MLFPSFVSRNKQLNTLNRLNYRRCRKSMAQSENLPFDKVLHFIETKENNRDVMRVREREGEPVRQRYIYVYIAKNVAAKS